MHQGEENLRREHTDIQADWEVKKAKGMTLEQYLEELRSKAFHFESAPDTLKTLKIAFEETGILPKGWKINPYDRDRYAWSEDGLSLLLADWLRGKAYYNFTEETWYIFRSGYGYVADNGEKEINGLVREFVKELEYAYSLMQNQRFKKKFWKKYLERFDGIRTRKQIVRTAGVELGVTSEEFDAEDNVVAAQNKLIILNDDGSHSVREITPEDKITKHFNMVYDKDADCPRYKQMLREIFLNDEELILFFQIFMGYILHGGNPQKAFAIFFAPGTNNGKSTILELLCELYHDYGFDAPETIISREKRSGSQASPDVVETYGRRIVTVHEPSEGMKMDEHRVKNYAGNAMITARRLYEGLIRFMPKFTIIMDCNELPIITDLSIFERGTIIVFPFDKSFNKEERDGKLIEKLRKESSGILNWLLEGWRMYREMCPNDEEWKLPARIQKQTMEYFRTSDPVRVFVEENLVITKDKNDRIEIKEMRSMYLDYTKANGIEACTVHQFNKKLAAILGRKPDELKMDSNGKCYYTGVRLKDGYEPQKDYFEAYLEEKYTFTRFIGVDIGRTRLNDLVDGYSAWISENGVGEKPSFSNIIAWVEARQDRFQIHWHDGCPWVYGLRKRDANIDDTAENLEIS